MHFPVPKVASLPSDIMRDITATLPTEVCLNVCVEPDLQPVTADQLHGASATLGSTFQPTESGGGRFEKTYFDVRVLNPLAPTNSRHRSAGMYRAHEREKKRAYEQCVWKVEHSGSGLHPPSPVCHWRHGNKATTFFKCLASLLAKKCDSHYSSTLCWLRCRLSFSLLRSAIQAIRGARSSRGLGVMQLYLMSPPLTSSLLNPPSCYCLYDYVIFSVHWTEAEYLFFCVCVYYYPILMHNKNSFLHTKKDFHCRGLGGWLGP